ncbi:MAG: hypothetical protein ABF893_18765, partial [Gluconacetobacter liquefaciens]
ELNDGPPEAIADLVRRHMLVRTRADANTMEGRSGDPTRRMRPWPAVPNWSAPTIPISSPRVGRDIAWGSGPGWRRGATR